MIDTSKKKKSVVRALVDDGKDRSNLSIASENKYLVLKRQVIFRITEELDTAH